MTRTFNIGDTFYMVDTTEKWCEYEKEGYSGYVDIPLIEKVSVVDIVDVVKTYVSNGAIAEHRQDLKIRYEREDEEPTESIRFSQFFTASTTHYNDEDSAKAEVIEKLNQFLEIAKENLEQAALQTVVYKALLDHYSKGSE